MRMCMQQQDQHGSGAGGKEAGKRRSSAGQSAMRYGLAIWAAVGNEASTSKVGNWRAAAEVRVNSLQHKDSCSSSAVEPGV